jgi:hypothetical protein
MNSKYKYLNKRFTNNSGESGFVLKYVNTHEVYFQFDITGWIGCFQMDHIKKGSIKDKMSPSVLNVGFFGEGKYKNKENGVVAKSYRTWHNMLERCYDNKYQEKKPTYIGCSVDKQWLNYQVFAEWYEENYPNDGKDYHLDKDALIEHNRVYGPDTCCFLTAQQNTEVALAKHYAFTSPDGKIIEVFNLATFCKKHNLNKGSMYRVANGKLKQHKGWARSL